MHIAPSPCFVTV